VVVRSLSICTGAGMLDLGFHLAAEHAGIGEVRPVCYVEREAYAAANLVAKMEAGALDAAPIWADVGTLTSPECRAYLGATGVDAIVGGIPCQPFSLAGKRLYSDDPRDLLGKTLELVECFAPQYVALENVAGFVVPDGLGRLAEGLDHLGYDVAAILLRASDVGATHSRARVFILARTRMEDAKRGRPGGRRDGDSTGDGRQIQTAGRLGELADAQGQGRRRDGITWGYGPQNAGLDSNSRALGNPNGKRGAESGLRVERGKQAYCRSGRGLFAPAKNDTRAWLYALRERPDLCPSLPSFALDAFGDEAPPESSVRGMAYGMARAMVQRQHRLRLVGNGVVPLQAAVAYSLLFDALGGTR